MATFKGTMRSYGASVRKIERENQRKTREATKRFKEQQKLQEIVNAKQAVDDWENYVETIQSVHKNCTEPIDWKQIQNIKKPIEPQKETTNELLAKNKLERFKPSIFNQIFGSTEKRIKRLNEDLNNAKQNDEKKYTIKYKDFHMELNNWEELQSISYGVKNKEINAYQRALTYFDPFSDIGELGTQISLDITHSFIDIDLKVNSSEVIPNYELKQTSTGKLSKKNMPKSRFNELYQDHICSATIRISREVFAYLPIEYARINAVSKVINKKTGHLEEQPILSVIFTPQTIEGLNLETIDPSDSMNNFVHNMKFSKTKGFSIIEKVELEY